ncbi:MAG: SUMF1/EgtB/PvdO family nonheme iron enzyme [Pseudomonadota bacterium]
MNDVAEALIASLESPKVRPPLNEIQARVIDITIEHIGVDRDKISLDSRLVDDLHVESLDLVKLVMAVEDYFQLTLPEPDEVGDLVYKEVFTRADFTVGDMAELVHLRWRNPPPAPRPAAGVRPTPATRDTFAQLGGLLESAPKSLYRALGPNQQGVERFRRLTDGMACLRLPGGPVELGSEEPDAGADERPLHQLELAPFLIDEEIVSTTAYCRFLNSIGALDEATERAWFRLPEDERRFAQQPLRRERGFWVPYPGTETWPMVLVSWFGAKAYALWANGADWRVWAEAGGDYLPSEAQWEYAARGPRPRRWPWGERAPYPGEINAGLHVMRARYATASELPLLPVHALSGVSPFGLLQMAGNVWQWCRDWYDPEAYEKARNGSESAPDTGVRSERGGSWVGPVELARSSYRRGRRPLARGRCLGFRCVGQVPA